LFVVLVAGSCFCILFFSPHHTSLLVESLVQKYSGKARPREKKDREREAFGYPVWLPN
jgi:hypothetical protein